MTQGVICLCSRGLIHSRTLKSIWRVLPRDWRPNWELLTTDDLPIPEAQTSITQEALALDPSWIFYVEEDMGLPDGILEDMIAQGNPVVTVDYNIGRYDEQLKKWITTQKSIRRSEDGKIRICGMGCLLVNAEVFGSLKRPWFDTFQLSKEGGIHGVKVQYGGQDCWFSRRIIDAGIEIGEVKADCKHYRLEDPGSIKSNDGVHKVIEL
jgi:hypothetical protein